MMLLGLPFGHVLALWLFLATVEAYGPLPPAPSPNRPPLMDVSPWTPIRLPKYFNHPPPRPVYGMRIPPTSKPVIDQRPSYTPAVKQEVSSMPSSQWMPIVPEQQPAAPAVQEMSVVFELPTESPVQAPAPIPALPSTGRLPLVPLVFRVPSTSGPAVQTWEGPISSGAWSGPEDTPQLPQAQMQDQSALSQGFNDDPSSWGAWPGQEEAVVPPPPPAQTQEPSALPEGTNEPLGPPGTFLPLPGDLNAPVQNPDGQPQPPSVDSWPDTPTDVPGVQLIPPLAPATFGQFAVPPAG